MLSPEILFETKPEEDALIRQIVKRAKLHICPLDETHARMDIAAVHCNGCPLDLDYLLAAETNSFLHDVYGISRHLNRETGELQNHFLPHCAQWQPESDAA